MPTRLPISALKCPPSSTSTSSILAEQDYQQVHKGGEVQGNPGMTHPARNNTRVSTVGTAPSKHSSILNVKITFPKTEDPKEAVQSSICNVLWTFQKYDRASKSDKRQQGKGTRPQPKRSAADGRSNTKRWTQQTITSNKNNNANNTSKRRKHTNN